MCRNLFHLVYIVLMTLSFEAESYAQHPEDSVMKVRVRYSDLKLDGVPEYQSYEELMRAFKYIRDTKFLTYKGVDRKIPWLHVKDGCHVRAQHAVDELEKAGFPKPKKIFLHGLLDISNEYFQLKEGEIIWQHIAPVVRVGGVNYVLDPALNREAPMPLHLWISSMTTDYDKIMLALCDGSTLIQTSSCYEPDPKSETDLSRLAEDTQWMLRFEWNIIQNKTGDAADILLN